MAMNSKKIKNTDHFRGSPAAPMLLIEYGDFECPHCANAFPILERVVEGSGEDFCFVYRHFPLVNSHPNAEFAAVASEAVGRQNLFWDMHRLLFENFDELSEENIMALAGSLKIDVLQFQDDIEDEDLWNKVREDFSTGIQDGVNGTPTLFLNGIRYEGPKNYRSLKQAIEAMLGDGGIQLGI